MSSIYDISVTTIDGQPKTLADYKGKAMLVVNVASKCGLTPQYEQLEALYEAKENDDFVVLGFPCNQFAGQEPGSEAEIQEFCRGTFGVKFPMFSKVDVNGETRHPLYQHLIAEQPKHIGVKDSQLEAVLSAKGLASSEPTDVKWNFEKFLVNKNCKVVARFAPDITTDNPDFQAKLNEIL